MTAPTGTQREVRIGMLRPIKSPLARLLDGMCEREHTSLNQLAARVFIHHTHLSRLRAGTRMPSIHLVLAMVEHWPLTKDEAIELCTHFHVLPPGYRASPIGEFEVAAMSAGRI